MESERSEDRLKEDLHDRLPPRLKMQTTAQAFDDEVPYEQFVDLCHWTAVEITRSLAQESRPRGTNRKSSEQSTT